MKTSAKGIKAIALREGTILKGYRDSKGLLTIGVGHLVKPGEPYTLGGKITQAESDRLLAADLKESEDAINTLVKVPLAQNQFDALASFIFNIGVGGFKKSSVLRRLNQKDYTGAAKALMMWVKPPEITGRRRQEQKQFLTPYPANSAATVSDASDKSNPGSSANSETPAESLSSAAADISQGNSTTVAEPVTVKAVVMSLWSKVVAGLAALTALGINAGTVIETKLSEITTNQVMLLVIGAVILIAVLWYIQKRQAANDAKTHALIAAAADKERNTVALEK